MPGQTTVSINDENQPFGFIKYRYIFVDNSNLYISAQKNEKGNNATRLSVEGLDKFINTNCGGNLPVAQREVAGSGNNSRIWKEYKKLGFKVHSDKRGGPEAFVDQALQVSLQSLLLNKTLARCPQVLVLCTGDSNREFSREATFPNILELFLEKGWVIHLCGWKGSIGKSFKNLQTEYPHLMTIHYLDDHWDTVTFQQNTQQSNNQQYQDRESSRTSWRTERQPVKANPIPPGLNPNHPGLNLNHQPCRHGTDCKLYSCTFDHPAGRIPPCLNASCLGKPSGCPLLHNLKKRRSPCAHPPREAPQSNGELQKNLCSICSEPATHGLLHGHGIHFGFCHSCALQQVTCPTCSAKVEKVVKPC